jgi:hypothetical protein
MVIEPTQFKNSYQVTSTDGVLLRSCDKYEYLLLHYGESQNSALAIDKHSERRVVASLLILTTWGTCPRGGQF